MDNTWKKIMNC